MSELSEAAPERLACQHCQDAIGAYEPLVVETPTGWHRTSLVVDPWLYTVDQACYHQACYERIHGDLR